jgi:hypothetical protein
MYLSKQVADQSGSPGGVMPTVKELLQSLDLGKSVAEFDEDLEAYFIETEAFRSLVNDQTDIVAGDKGTEKTAIFRILQKRFPKIERLKEIEVVPAFNPRGSSIFEKFLVTAPSPITFNVLTVRTPRRSGHRHRYAAYLADIAGIE